MSPADDQLPSGPGPDDSSSPGAGGTPTLDVALPANPASAAVVRDRLREWLGILHWPADAADDVVMAVSEAVSNSVDHAYRDGHTGEVRISAQAQRAHEHSRRVCVTVSDDGTWRPIPRDPGYRRRGLTMMAACMADLEIDRQDHGTTVRMRSTPIAPPIWTPRDC
jgi:anti-sigma regulatory factor (Ser/Thr protein kinase)